MTKTNSVFNQAKNLFCVLPQLESITRCREKKGQRSRGEEEGEECEAEKQKEKIQSS